MIRRITENVERRECSTAKTGFENSANLFSEYFRSFPGGVGKENSQLSRVVPTQFIDSSNALTDLPDGPAKRVGIFSAIQWNDHQGIGMITPVRSIPLFFDGPVKLLPGAQQGIGSAFPQPVISTEAFDSSPQFDGSGSLENEQSRRLRFAPPCPHPDTAPPPGLHRGFCIYPAGPR